MNYISLLFFSAFSLYLIKVIIEKITNKSVDFYKNNNWIKFWFVTILIYLNSLFIIEYVRIIFSFFIMYFGMLKITKCNKIQVFFAVVILQLLNIFIELMNISLICWIFKISFLVLSENHSLVLFLNLMSYIIMYLIINSNYTKRYYDFINNLVLEVKRDYKLFLSFIIMLLFNIMIVNIYVEITYSIYIFLNIGMMFIITTILYRILVEKNKNAIIETKNKIYEVENESLINSLNEYEIVADKHRRDSHENNNQLNSIYLMLQSKSETSEVLDYIKSLQGTDKLADISNLKRTKKIPSGGLQGIIYQKIIHMDKKNIKNNLNISRDMKYFDFNKFNSDLMIDVCKILGVFLDNAIEEVITIENRIISIELFKLNNDFCISVKNTYTKSKNFSDIYDSGYSTKGKDRGFGLSLVKELVTNNKRITHETVITDKYFTQTIKVKGMIKKS